MRQFTRLDAAAGIGILFLVAGLLPPAMMNATQSNKQRSATNNLKIIGLGFHSFNDTMNYLPFNGGHTDPDKLKTINYGWHSPNVRDSGTWATMILPFLEQDPLYRNAGMTGEAHDKVPAFLTDGKNHTMWTVTIKTYNCPERGRIGFKTGTEKGSMPGVLTDYAVNTFINDAPVSYTQAGRPGQNFFATSGGLACRENQRMTIQGIADGSNNTVLVGQKAMSKALMDSKEASAGDEGIFSPGHYTPKGKESKVASSGTGRGHRVDPKSKLTEDQKTMPKDGGVAWMHADKDLAGKDVPDFGSDWGGPFEKGVLFLWGDGTVRMLNYKLNGTFNFARMLYPSDGAVVTFD